jgi:hypothetical protein
MDHKHRALAVSSAILATSLLGMVTTAEAKATPPSAIQSATGFKISVDAYGRPSLSGHEVGDLISAKAKQVGQEFAGNNCDCTNTGTTCVPPEADKAPRTLEG